MDPLTAIATALVAGAAASNAHDPNLDIDAETKAGKARAQVQRVETIGWPN